MRGTTHAVTSRASETSGELAPASPRAVRGPLARRLPRRLRDSFAAGDLTPTIIGCVLILGIIYGFWAIATRVTPDIWVPMLVFAGLIAVSIPICFRLAGHPSKGIPTDNRLLKIIILAFMLKMACVFPRWYVNEYVYKGQADAGQYDNAGKVFYNNFHQGEWSLKGSMINNFPQETRNVGYFAGVLYLAVGTTYMGGYMVFTWISWIGLVFFFKAFRTAYPNAPPYFVAKLLFFLPSMLYWPSSLGKDAMMVFCIGLLTLGIARLLTLEHFLRGAAYAAAGGYLIVLVRPHILVIALAAVAASLLAQSAAKQHRPGAVAWRFILLLILIPGIFVGLGRVDEFFGHTESGNNLTVTEAFEKTGKQTTIGGSSFETRPVKTPLDLPPAIISVLYRPFIFEASSLPVFISALEGTALLVGTVIFGAWIWRIGPAMYRNAFAAYCGAYVLVFIIAFSNVGNAGILARQRVQMFPLLMLVVAAAREHARTHDKYALMSAPAVRAAPSSSAQGVSAAHPI